VTPNGVERTSPVTATETTLQAFLAEHAIVRVWHTGFDEPAGDEHIINTDEDAADEDYCDSEGLLSILTDWLTLDLSEIEGTVTRDDDGEFRWEWDGEGDRRNCRGNSIYRLTVWGE
jgi:hypothetical protein